MYKLMKERTENLEIRLDGDKSIQAETLAGVLDGIVSMLKAIANETLENAGEIKQFNAQTVNIYVENPTIDESLSETFKKVRSDDTRTSMTVESGSKKITVSSSDQEAMSYPADLSEVLDHIAVNQMKTTIRPVQISLYGNAQWTFWLNTTRIKAKIADDEFIKDVHDGKYQFSAGTSLKVTLEARYPVDSSGLPKDGHTEYTVIKVNEVIEPKKYNQISADDLD